ncbi:hypothetical protein MJ1HA_1871 [Metallosphaera sedula]|nr:hypothetical protein MJ1HA_1871 [Metallosphaera sedula]
MKRDLGLINVTRGFEVERRDEEKGNYYAKAVSLGRTVAKTETL